MEGSIGFTGLLEGDIECGGGSGVTPHVTATASVDANTGTPTVTVIRSGPDAAPNFDFAFQNLKGEKGDTGSQGIQGVPGPAGSPGSQGPRGFTGETGATGPQGPAGETPTITAQASVDANIGTPSVNVTKTGTILNPNFEFEFHNLRGDQGPQGNPGSAGPEGPAGPAGPGIALGGTIGQFLKKAGAGDYVTEWGDITAAEVGLDITNCQIVTETDLQGAVEELDAAVVAVNSSLTHINYPPKKATGTALAVSFMCMGAQIDANRIAIAVPFPFLCENTNYTVNIASCTLVGIAVLSPSDVSIDNKQTTGMRLIAQYSGTAKQAYMCQVGMTITY